MFTSKITAGIQGGGFRMLNAMTPQFETTVYLFFLICSIWVLPCRVSAEPQPPTLGIIAMDKEAEPFADLLTAKFSGSGLVQLVEREQMAEIMQEWQLAAIQKSDSVAIGQMIRASGLLFIDVAQDVIRIRISETQRGELLYQHVFPNSDMSAICEMVVRHFPSLASKLTFTGPRIYIAVRPVQMTGTSRADMEMLDKFRYLLEECLSCGDEVVLVERETLGDLSMEREVMEATDGSKLSAADYVIRIAAEKSESGEYSISVRAMSTNGKESELFSDHFDWLAMEDAAARLGTEILKHMGRTPANSTAHLVAEADLQRNVAQLLLNHEDFLRGLPGLEVAYLLHPEDEEAAVLLARYIRQYLEKTANVVGLAGNRYFLKCERDEPEAYMGYVHWLRMAMTVARRHPQGAGYLFPDMQLDPLAFLTSPPRGLSSQHQLLLGDCRAELKDFYEWYGQQPETAGHNPVTFVFPLFFSDPEDAFRYLKTSLKESELSSIRWCEHPFAWITYWDISKARKLWTGFMEELISSGARDRQYEGLACLCYDNGAFGNSFTWRMGDPALAVPSAQRLFRWLSQDDDNLAWFVQAEIGYTIARLQRALGLLPPENQDRYFREVMNPILKAPHPNIPGAFIYPETRRWKGSAVGNSPQNPAVSAPAVREAAGETDPASLADLERLESEKRMRNMAQRRKAGGGLEDSWFELSSGGKILFESEGGDGSLGFQGASLLVDGNTVWIGWSEKGGFGLARKDLDEMDRESMEFHGSTDKAYGSWDNPLRLVRWRDYLVLAGASGVVAIPLDAAGLPRVLEKRELGPQIGDSTMGYENRRVSAIVPGPDGVYVCLCDRNRYGGIYLWNPDETNGQKVCSSDSFSSGPLNDCLPYHVFAGCLAPGGQEMYFFVAGAPSQSTAYESGQRFGVWKYAPLRNSWIQVSSNDFGYAQGAPLTPTHVTENVMLVGTSEAIYGFNLVAENLRQLFHRAGRYYPHVSGAWQLGRDNMADLEFAQACATIETSASKFSFDPRKLWFRTAMPTEHGLLVLLCGINGHQDGILCLVSGEEK